MDKTLPQNVVSRLRPRSNGCVEWIGAKTPAGYGVVRIDYVLQNVACIKAGRTGAHLEPRV